MASQTVSKAKREGDISVTAFYTSQAWVFGGFDAADLLATRYGRWVFRVTNLVLKLARLFGRGPVLACSLVQRHAMIDHIVLATGATQVIELAAGLSRRGASMSRDAGLRYVELDLAPMIATKRRILERVAAGREVLGRPNLDLEAADLRETDLSAYVEPAHPTCVVAEGLLIYLSAAEQRLLWQRVARALASVPAGTFVFDLVPASEAGFDRRIAGGLLRLFSGGKTFEADTRSRHDIAAELRAAGFDGVEMLEPGPLIDAWQLPFGGVRTQVLLFRCRVEPRAGGG